LRQAAGEGRLTMEELEERLIETYDTRTRHELETLLADLVGTDRALPGVRHARVPVRRGDGGTGWLVSIMSGRDRRGRWRLGPSLKVVNVMGGSDLDLNDAEFSDDVVEMTVVSVMGGADIRVPEGLNVEVSEFALMGGNTVVLGDERPDPGGPLLRLRMLSIMGGTDVKRGRKLTRAERRELKRSGH
ncbi:MAG: hypothetical protein QOE86_4416, partial [Solirubrobacteraceae bacterium]|nr:hypothetical protein [Solirubrobacteraceae bacterium]